jgi:chromosome segregation ATPase
MEIRDPKIVDLFNQWIKLSIDNDGRQVNSVIKDFNAYLRATEPPENLGEADVLSIVKLVNEKNQLGTLLKSSMDENRELKARHAALHEKYQGIESYLSESETEIMRLRDEVKGLKQKVQDSDADVTDYHQRNLELERSLANTQDKVLELGADRDNWKRTAETRGDLLSKRELEIRQLKAQVSDYEGMIKGLGRQIKSLKADLVSVEKNRDQLETWRANWERKCEVRDAEIKELKAERDALQIDKDGYISEIQELKVEIREVVDEIGRFLKVGKLENIKAYLRELSEKHPRPGYTDDGINQFGPGA